MKVGARCRIITVHDNPNGLRGSGMFDGREVIVTGKDPVTECYQTWLQPSERSNTQGPILLRPWIEWTMLADGTGTDLDADPKWIKKWRRIIQARRTGPVTTWFA